VKNLSFQHSSATTAAESRYIYRELLQPVHDFLGIYYYQERHVCTQLSNHVLHIKHIDVCRHDFTRYFIAMFSIHYCDRSIY
jgi:hypothetical protein